MQVRTIRHFAVQGHEVPKTAYSPHGPFPSEILQKPKMVYEDQHPDSLHEALDDVRMFRCKECRTVLYEDELSNHLCKEN